MSNNTNISQNNATTVIAAAVVAVMSSVNATITLKSSKSGLTAALRDVVSLGDMEKYLPSVARDIVSAAKGDKKIKNSALSKVRATLRAMANTDGQPDYWTVTETGGKWVAELKAFPVTTTEQELEKKLQSLVAEYTIIEVIKMIIKIVGGKTKLTAILKTL